MSAWATRQGNVMEMLESLAEGMDKSISVLLSDIGIESIDPK